MAAVQLSEIHAWRKMHSAWRTIFGIALLLCGLTTCLKWPSAEVSSKQPGSVLFDDFNYSGSSDPNLAAHDWTVRTAAGGPGVTGATWSANAITFPTSTAAGGSHVMQLTASTDGTGANTVQAEIDTTSRKFLDGTYAAKVYLTDAPTTGPNGDDVNETFYAISPLASCDDPNYSENDFE